MSKAVTEIQSDQFQQLVLESPRPVILDFYSTECPPCEALAPKFSDLAERFAGEITFYKIFRQGSRELAAELGVSSSPTLLFFKDGQEAAGRLSGGIQKGAILEHIRQLVPDEVFHERAATGELRKRQVDVAIVGGGPAGMTAAIYAAQAKLSTLLLDQAMPGGQVSITHQIANYPGTEKPIPGWELAHKMSVQAADSGAEILSAVDINRIDLSGATGKILVDQELEIEARTVILAMGAEPRLLGLPGEKEYRGRGISYCATCDGKFYEDQDIIVIGGGNSAIEEAIYLTRFASSVTVVHQFDHLQANKTAQERAFANPKINFVWNSEPRKFELLENGRMVVTIENVKTGLQADHETAGVFIFVGMAPRTDAVVGPLKTNEWGYIPTNEDMETNIPGVYAVGDIREKKFRQVATAVNDGCIAAIVAEKYIESFASPAAERMEEKTQVGQ